MSQKYDIVKNACNEHEHVYLLVDSETFEILRMAWGNNLSEAEAYFKTWLEQEYKLIEEIVYEDCFVVEVAKETMRAPKSFQNWFGSEIESPIISK
ncbi:MAG: hypothetical protein MJZ20_01325 [Bacteroidaceae bacterium]|nr:hypothetical protein [Bacteroidaceae bacterium]